MAFTREDVEAAEKAGQCPECRMGCGPGSANDVGARSCLLLALNAADESRRKRIALHEEPGVQLMQRRYLHMSDARPADLFIANETRELLDQVADFMRGAESREKLAAVVTGRPAVVRVTVRVIVQPERPAPPLNETAPPQPKPGGA